MRKLAYYVAGVFVVAGSLACGSKNEPVEAGAQGGQAARTNSNQVPQPAPSPPAPAETSASAAASGASVYKEQKCDLCHGVDGKGTPGMKGVPNFTDAVWQKSKTDDSFEMMIRDGKLPMPAYGDKLTDTEIQSVVAYIRSLR